MMKTPKLVARIPKNIYFFTEEDDEESEDCTTAVAVRIKKPRQYSRFSSGWKQTLVPNDPVEKIRVIELEQRHKQKDAWFIEFPFKGKNYTTFISAVSLESLLTSDKLTVEDGWLKGPFVWAVLRQRIVTLVPVETEFGLQISEATKIFDTPYLKEEDAVVGGVYQTRQQDPHMFLGEICWDEIVSKEHEPIQTETVTGKVWTRIYVGQDGEHSLTHLSWASEMPPVTETLIQVYETLPDFIQSSRRRLFSSDFPYYKHDYAVWDYPRATARKVGEPCPKLPEELSEEYRQKSRRSNRGW
jgi:hypothetical protein